MRLRSLHTATTEKELKDKIMNCSTDITYIIQRASIQSNVRSLCHFACRKVTFMVYIQGSRSEASLQLMSSAQLELSRAKRMLTGTSKVSKTSIYDTFDLLRQKLNNSMYFVATGFHTVSWSKDSTREPRVCGPSITGLPQDLVPIGYRRRVIIY